MLKSFNLIFHITANYLSIINLKEKTFVEMLKIIELFRNGDISPTACVFITFIILGTIVAKIYIGKPE